MRRGAPSPLAVRLLLVVALVTAACGGMAPPHPPLDGRAPPPGARPTPGAAPPAATVRAASAAPALPPLPPPTLAALPAVRTGTLPSGARYHLVTHPGPLAVVQLRVAAGALDGAPGVAAVTAAAVAQGAASGRPAPPFRDRFDALGASLRSHVTAVDTVFTVLVPAPARDRAITLLTQLLASPTLAHQHHQQLRQRAVARARVRATHGSDSIMLTAMQRLLLHHGDAEGAPAGGGSASEIATISATDAAAFYARHYHPAAVTLSLIGGDPNSAERAASQALATLPPAPTAATTPAAATPGAAVEGAGHPLRVIVLDTPAARHTRLLWARLLTPSQRRWPGGALLAQRVLETALRRAHHLNPGSDGELPRAQVLPWLRGAGVLVLWDRAPHRQVAQRGLQLQQTMRALGPAVDAAGLSALRLRLAGDSTRAMRSAPALARWLLRRDHQLAPQDQRQLRQLLHQTPAVLPTTTAQVLLVAGPAAGIAQGLRSLGEVVVVDAARNFARVNAFMPNFDIVHGEPASVSGR